ncbi:hypothetical protein ACIO1C_07485 [Streptomyces sp. NPDC087420]|uniref:hypothetical protein n=1 Tax=Streptomyces sp. NPDC087420 TaxID=3365785 RepID=UPI003837A8F6
MAGLSAQFLAEDWEALPEQAMVSDISSFEPKADLTVTTAEKIADNRNPLPADRPLPVRRRRAVGPEQ